MRGYNLGQRVRWAFVAVTVVFIALMVFAAITNAGKNRREQCWEAQKTSRFESFLGTDLGWVRLNVRWCGDGNKITALKQAKVTAKTTTAGSVSGWEKKETTKSKNWFEWRGSKRGGRFIRATVHFHRSPLPPVTIPDDEYVSVSMKIAANGANTGDFGGGGAW